MFVVLVGGGLEVWRVEVEVKNQKNEAPKRQKKSLHEEILRDHRICRPDF